MLPDIFRHGRAALLWGLASFLALQLGLAIAIARWLPGFGDPNYGFKSERLRRHFAGYSGDATRLLALGSSRTLFGLDASGLGQDLTAATGRPAAVFNFGVRGAGPITELLYLRKMLGEGIVPDFVLIEVLPPFLAGQVRPPAEARWFLPNTRLSSAELDLLARHGFPTSALRQSGRRSWLLPWCVHRRALLSRLGPSWLPYGLRLEGVHAADAAGWIAASPLFADRRRTERVNREHFAACFEDFSLDGTPAAALRELLNICRRRRIQAVLVLMPETARFRNWYPPEIQEKLRTFLHGLGAPRIDARCWVPDAGFFDADHLHPGGAAILRRKLSRALVPLVKGVSEKGRGEDASAKRRPIALLFRHKK